MPWLFLHFLHLNPPCSSLLPFNYLFLSFSSSLSYTSAMKLTINPKRLFRSKKSPKVTRSEPSSSSSYSSDLLTNVVEGGTPKSVLPADEVPGDWSDFSSDLYSELAHAFKLLDKDGDGKISKKELEALLLRVGGGKSPAKDEIAIMIGEIDRDGDGIISFEDFGAISSAFRPASDDSELRDTFNFFDTDHDGKITAVELLNVFTSIGDDRCTLEDCRRMIARVDKNGDGFVSFEDFTLMMEHQ